MSEVAFVFAPGAGASSSSVWMQRYAALLGRLGPVIAFDYDYMKAGKRAPDRLPKLIEAHAAAIDAARKDLAAGSPRKWVLVGKSMGGRVGCHVSLEERVDGVVCLGYPLCAMGNTKKLRDEVLLAFFIPGIVYMADAVGTQTEAIVIRGLAVGVPRAADARQVGPRRLALIEAEELSRIADVAGAMSVEGQKGTPAAFDSRIQEARLAVWASLLERRDALAQIKELDRCDDAAAMALRRESWVTPAMSWPSIRMRPSSGS